MNQEMEKKSDFPFLILILLTWQGKAVRELLAHRLSPRSSEEARKEWYEIVEGEHSLWDGVSEPYKHTIRAFLVHFHTQILRNSSERFNFRNGSVGMHIAKHCMRTCCPHVSVTCLCTLACLFAIVLRCTHRRRVCTGPQGVFQFTDLVCDTQTHTLAVSDQNSICQPCADSMVCVQGCFHEETLVLQALVFVHD